jgi:hypothetical protein
VLNGLEQLFGLRLHPDGISTFNNRVLFMLFAATVDSFLALRTPWSRFMEAGLLLRKIEEAGSDGERVMAAGEWIDALTAESRETHLEMLDALISAMLGDRGGTDVQLSRSGGARYRRREAEPLISEPSDTLRPIRRRIAGASALVN